MLTSKDIITLYQNQTYYYSTVVDNYLIGIWKMLDRESKYFYEERVFVSTHVQQYLRESQHCLQFVIGPKKQLLFLLFT